MTYDEAIADAKARYTPEAYYFEALHPWAKDLGTYRYDVTSQTGEDGIIAEIFRRIGVKNLWCFEVGAADGQWISNTWVLRIYHGWRSVLIESSDDKFNILLSNFGKECIAVHKKIEPDTLEPILSNFGAPIDMDFGVIDIDGQDYHIWKGMKKYRPRLMMVEFSSDVEPVPPVGGEGQAGIAALLELAGRKNYVAVCRTNCNLFFIEGGVFNANSK